MISRKAGGFRLGRRLVRIWRWILSGRSRSYCRLKQRHRSLSPAAAANLLPWIQFFKGMIRAEQAWGDEAGLKWRLLVEEKKPPPRGYLAVYVGCGGEEEFQQPQRYVVPVFYFNHPLFADLLREAEEEFGFYHPGGITLPCPASRFERVQSRIAACCAAARRSSFRRNNFCL